MDMFGLSAPTDFFPIDDLLDFSNVNDELLSSSSSSTLTAATTDPNFPHRLKFPPSDPNMHFPCSYSSDISDHLSVPNDDDVAEFEWLSNFVDDPFSDFPANPITSETASFRSDGSFHCLPRSKRSRATSTNGSWTSTPESDALPPTIARCKLMKASANRMKRENSSERTTEPSVVRRCTHCESEKTPQWRTGPLGPKTLCNACGVRYKSGRLVPEYRPAASPTFVLTQHSNSHRKVIELRRQKELLRQRRQLQQEEQQQHSQCNFEVC